MSDVNPTRISTLCPGVPMRKSAEVSRLHPMSPSHTWFFPLHTRSTEPAPTSTMEPPEVLINIPWREINCSVVMCIWTEKQDLSADRSRRDIELLQNWKEIYCHNHILKMNRYSWDYLIWFWIKQNLGGIIYLWHKRLWSSAKYHKISGREERSYYVPPPLNLLTDFSLKESQRNGGKYRSLFVRSGDKKLVTTHVLFHSSWEFI